MYGTLALFLFAVGDGLTTEDDPDDDEAEDEALLTRDRCSAVTLVVYLFRVVQGDHGGQRLGFVPFYARFCLGSFKLDRNCRAVGQHCGTSRIK